MKKAAPPGPSPVRQGKLQPLQVCLATSFKLLFVWGLGAQSHWSVVWERQTQWRQWEVLACCANARLHKVASMLAQGWLLLSASTACCIASSYPPGTPMKLQWSEFASLAGHEYDESAFCNILPCRLQNTIHSRIPDNSFLHWHPILTGSSMAGDLVVPNRSNKSSVMFIYSPASILETNLAGTGGSPSPIVT